VAHVLLGLGTNLGDRAANLRAALLALRHVIDVHAVSDVYESEPFGHTEQPHFWNLAVDGTSTLEPLALMHALQRLETQLGRVPSFRMGPRLIDIDILFCDDIIMHTDALTLPHPGITQRAFVLRPLLDLAPQLRHPVSGELLATHLQQLGDDGMLRVGSARDVLGFA